MFSFQCLFFAIVATVLSLSEDVKTPEKINCFGLGTVKLTNTTLGVRDVGLVFTKKRLLHEESGAGPTTDITSPASE